MDWLANWIFLCHTVLSLEDKVDMMPVTLTLGCNIKLWKYTSQQNAKDRSIRFLNILMNNCYKYYF